jgi:hypothetical protein
MEVWTDCSRDIVSRSVLVTSELPGEPLPIALKRYPDDQQSILDALAKYLSQIHELRFAEAGYIEFCGDESIDASLMPDRESWWNSHPCQSAENLTDLAIVTLESMKHLLSDHLYLELNSRFSSIPDRLHADFEHPTFVINNYHPFHMHVVRDGGDWAVTGFYDFEAVSSGNAMFDLALNDLQITPLLGTLSWRKSFYRSYRRPVRLESYKTILLIYLILGLATDPSDVVPDPSWFRGRLPWLLKAETLEDLRWYPEGDQYA